MRNDPKRRLRTVIYSGLAVFALVALEVRAQFQIPEDVAKRMSRAGVAGVVLVLVDGRRIAAAKAFGVSSEKTGEPLVIDGVFEAASNGKVVAAYALLSLEDGGYLSLAAPLVDSRLQTACGSPSLETVLMHTAGLGNNIDESRFVLDCGRRDQFAYAGEGYVLLETVFQQAVGVSSAVHIERTLLRPLGMTRSTMGVSREPIVDGHVDLLYATLSGRAEPGDRIRSMAIVTAGVVAWLFVVFWLRRHVRPVPQLTVSAVSFLIAAAAVLMALALLSTALPSVNRGNDIASSFKTTAPDLALFAMELMNPSLVSPEVVERLSASKTRVNERISWGLGLGIDVSNGITTWWHWGSNPGYQSLMVLHPESERAVIVLTNSGGFADLVLPGRGGYALARQLARDILGVHGHWSIAPP